MATLKWLPEALADLQRLHAFIAAHSEPAAARAIDTLIAAAERLAEFPGQGRRWDPDPDFREWPVSFGARGYVIRYRTHGDDVIIVRVWHGLEDRS